MKRWTIEELNEISELDFVLIMLNEKANSLTNPYAPLTRKIKEVIRKVESIKEHLKHPVLLGSITDEELTKSR